MQIFLTLVRALHYAAMLSLMGTLVIDSLVAGPALRRLGGSASIFWRRSAQLAWISLVLGILSGMLWLVLEASGMSGKPVPAALSQGVIPTVLSRTRFGHDWLLRGALTLPLVLCLLLRGRSVVATRLAHPTAIVLAAAEVATLAGAGHAAAGTGWMGALHLISDGAHLLAAGLWVGGLLPLALLFAETRRQGFPVAAAAASAAASRFSVIGLVAVGTLIATGVINSIFLVGSIPALLGTEYGHLLMLKLALFLTMVTFAAINRQWLMPQLLARSADCRDESRAIIAQVQRNALIEAGLGALVLLLVGALGTTPPALHVEPHWPLPFRLSLAALEARPEAWRSILVAGAVTAVGLALLAYGLMKPRQRSWQILVGLFMFIGLAWWPLQFMIVTAYPTTFSRSAAPFTASSIVHGAALYAENCSGCHGASGHGDGPLAQNMPVRPADLTAEHIFAHSEGDLFWWISQGIDAGGMPGFAEVLDERGRWDVINFIRARASAALAGVLTSEVTSVPAPAAPDFAFDREGREETLQHARVPEALLLVFYRLPESAGRLDQLREAEGRLGAARLRLLALPSHENPVAAPGRWREPDFAIHADAEVAAAYQLFAGSSRFDHCEFLVDRAGFLRARWCADSLTGTLDPGAIPEQLGRLAALPLEERPHTHTH